MSIHKTTTAALFIGLIANVSMVSSVSAGDFKDRRTARVNSAIAMNGKMAPTTNTGNTTTTNQPAKCRFTKCKDEKGVFGAIDMNGKMAPTTNTSNTTTTNQPAKCRFTKCKNEKGIFGAIEMNGFIATKTN